MKKKKANRFCLPLMVFNMVARFIYGVVICCMHAINMYIMKRKDKKRRRPAGGEAFLLICVLHLLRFPHPEEQQDRSRRFQDVASPSLRCACVLHPIPRGSFFIFMSPAQPSQLDSDGFLCVASAIGRDHGRCTTTAGIGALRGTSRRPITTPL